MVEIATQGLGSGSGVSEWEPVGAALEEGSKVGPGTSGNGLERPACCPAIGCGYLLEPIGEGESPPRTSSSKCTEQQPGDGGARATQAKPDTAKPLCSLATELTS